MNDHSQHITHYSAADIERYLSGNMTASEMHAMEKAALEDPFLADAIDGMEVSMQEHGAAAVNENLQQLHTAIAEKIRPRSGKIRAMLWFKISAAALVLIVSGLFLWNSTLNREVATSKTIADVQQQQHMPDTTVPAAAADEGFPAEFSTADSDSNAGNALSKKAFNSKAAKKIDAKSSKESLNAKLFSNEQPAANKLASVQAKAEELAASKQISLDTNVPAKVLPAPVDQKDLARRSENLRQQFNFSDTIGRPVKTEVVGALPGRMAGITVSNNGNVKLKNIIRGRVTDNFSRPIANANLQTGPADRGMGITYMTDREGYFNIPAKENDTSSLNVSVAAIGYNTQQFQLNRNIAANQLQLQPANQALNEVVVVGYGSKKHAMRKASVKETDILQQNAEPVYGWIGYEKYLRENTRIPADSAQTKGEVVVSFVVSRRGELSDFNVTNGLSPEADKEAIRLIKEGPSWKIKRGRKATATVIVRF